MPLILLVEDDERLALLVSDYLKNNGFEVVHESVGHNVPRCVKELQPDIVILDIMLPGRDGLTLCKELRDFYNNPILMLTARDSTTDQIHGLEVGADDYVIKPVEPSVLLARISALLRRTHRSQVETQNNIDIGTLHIKIASRRVEVSGEPIELSTHEFDLILALASQHGQVLSREYLFNIVYDRPYDGLDRTIDVRISQLRKKVGDAGEHPQKIKTVWGRGYLLVSDAW